MPHACIIIQVTCAVLAVFLWPKKIMQIHETQWVHPLLGKTSLLSIISDVHAHQKFACMTCLYASLQCEGCFETPSKALALGIATTLCTGAQNGARVVASWSKYLQKLLVAKTAFQRCFLRNKNMELPNSQSIIRSYQYLDNYTACQTSLLGSFHDYARQAPP